MLDEAFVATTSRLLPVFEVHIEKKGSQKAKAMRTE